MKFLCVLSVAVRLAGLAFVVGLVVGLVLGYRAGDGPAEPGRTTTTAVLASESPLPPPRS